MRDRGGSSSHQSIRRAAWKHRARPSGAAPRSEGLRPQRGGRCRVTVVVRFPTEVIPVRRTRFAPSFPEPGCWALRPLTPAKSSPITIQSAVRDRWFRRTASSMSACCEAIPQQRIQTHYRVRHPHQPGGLDELTLPQSREALGARDCSLGRQSLAVDGKSLQPVGGRHRRLHHADQGQCWWPRSDTE